MSCRCSCLMFMLWSMRWPSSLLEFLSHLAQKVLYATGRPNLTATWNSTFQANNVDVILYPGFAHSIPPVDAAGKQLD